MSSVESNLNFNRIVNLIWYEMYVVILIIGMTKKVITNSHNIVGNILMTFVKLHKFNVSVTLDKYFLSTEHV